ncbi:PQQ-binding-like beta-propeller repeat protein [Desulfoluna butyratoxydans]|uniref:Pyrrolo-quinoline quinone repeat n=1 Tax=Desulfoluna butyratoxydans TaxID=231438 RepID=A0A4U8YMV5_9BACT|nr:PQQ-binding-like beta-propeller repeat protein [Desulfoluna butyratoxydans]VFQ45395.1 pyrrolo-quinoline quinone repeat [Desulfoluna butyratoxydans]
MIKSITLFLSGAFSVVILYYLTPILLEKFIISYDRIERTKDNSTFPSVIYCSLAVDSKNIYFTSQIIDQKTLSSQSFIHSIDKSNGKENWRTEISDVTGSQIISTKDMVLIIGSTQIYAIDRLSGELLWDNKCEFINFSYTFDDNFIFIRNNGEISAIDMKNGEKSWVVQTYDNIPIGQISHKNGEIFYTNLDGLIKIVSATNGEEIGSYTTDIPNVLTTKR